MTHTAEAFGPLCAQCMHLLATAEAGNNVAEELVPTAATCRQLGCRGKECQHPTLAFAQAEHKKTAQDLGWQY